MRWRRGCARRWGSRQEVRLRATWIRPIMPPSRMSSSEGASDLGPRPAVVQDNARERQLLALLRLQGGKVRSGTDAHDENGNSYELKSSTGDDVGTGRDVGKPYLAAMRRRYLVVAFGANTQYGFNIERLFFLPPSALEDWIRERERKMDEDLAILDRLLAIVGDAVTESEANRLRYLVSRGATLNNPKIGRRYIEAYGLPLDDDDPAAQLRTYVEAHPLS
jgi:hypothetical protein